MANSIAYASLFQDALDKLIEQQAKTNWMVPNASRVKYNGGNEIKIGKLALDGLADYSRANGFEEGDVNLTWQTHQFDYDRGRKFTIDPMDVDEANFLPIATNIMGEFVRTKVIPEVDLVRIAKVASKAPSANVKEIVATKDNALEEFKAGIVAVRDAGYEGQLVAHVRYDFLNLLELRFASQLSSVTFKVGGIDTTFPSIDGVALIPTVSSRMYNKVTKDGETGAIAPAVDAGAVEFLIAGVDVPIGIAKHESIRTFTPEQYQDKNAWAMDYRLYHTALVEDNKVPAIYVALKGDASGE